MLLQIDKFRKNKGMTLEQLAQEMGMTRGNLQKIKAGNQDCGIFKIKKISEILNCYPSELLPLQWQKPSTQEVDVEILKEAILHAPEGKETHTRTGKPRMDIETRCEVIAALYEEKLRNSKMLSATIKKLNNKELTS